MASVRLSKIVDEDTEERISLNLGENIKETEDSVPLQEKDEKETKKTDWDYYLRYVSLVVLVLQNTSQVMLMRYATTRSGPKFLKTVAVFFNEVVKLIAATILFVFSVGSVRKALEAFHHHFIVDFVDTLKVGVPALIYTLQNFLLYVAIANLDSATYMVTYQLKILTTALFTVLMLKRRLSIVQWVSLLVLVAGVGLVQYSAMEDKDPNSSNVTTTTPSPNTDKQNPLIGLAAVLTACIMSGFAGIYFEKILKGSEVSIWLRNIQLAVLAIPFSLAIVAIKDHEKVFNNSFNDGFMRGFDEIVWAVVALQALGGLVVAVVVKYADNILKAFATSIAIIVSCVASIFLFSVYPEPWFIAGAALVIGSVVLYSVFPYKQPERPSQA